MADDMIDLNNAVIWLHLNNTVKITHAKVQPLVISWLGAGTRTLPRRGHLPRCRGFCFTTSGKCDSAPCGLPAGPQQASEADLSRVMNQTTS